MAAVDVSAHYGTYAVFATVDRNSTRCPQAGYSGTIALSGNPDGTGLTVTVSANTQAGLSTRRYQGKMNPDGTFGATGKGGLPGQNLTFSGEISGKAQGGGLLGNETLTFDGASACPGDIASWKIAGNK